MQENNMQNWREQEARIQRLLTIINADDPHKLISSLTFEDMIIITCQNMWHLKDWILSDSEFQSKNAAELHKDIHAQPCLMICADIANRSKHFKLRSSKTQTSEFKEGGMHLEPQKGIFQLYYWLVSENTSSPYHMMEIRDFLNECWDAWSEIIEKHYLSDIDINA